MKKKPWWASPDLAKRIIGVEAVCLFGISYEIPVTPDTLPFIRVLRNEKTPWEKGSRATYQRKRRVENGMQDLIAALVIQVRETVGQDVTTMLTQEIAEKMRPLIEARVRKEMAARHHALGYRKEG